jgi:hypothetical protein
MAKAWGGFLEKDYAWNYDAGRRPTAAANDAQIVPRGASCLSTPGYGPRQVICVSQTTLRVVGNVGVAGTAARRTKPPAVRQAMATAGALFSSRRNCGDASSRSWAERSERTAASSCSGGRVNGTRR